jgi:hypothetical protein
VGGQYEDFGIQLMLAILRTASQPASVITLKGSRNASKEEKGDGMN